MAQRRGTKPPIPGCTQVPARPEVAGEVPRIVARWCARISCA
jgi:hypothetical protein